MALNLKIFNLYHKRPFKFIRLNNEKAKKNV